MNYLTEQTLKYIPVLDYPESNLKEITCLCLTYGRFSLLREAVSFFLLQDYYKKKLIIINDSEIPINLGIENENIIIHNCKKRFKTIGNKRQFALEMANSPLVAHWDDDDTYLPWHLCRSSKFMEMSKMKLSKPHEILMRYCENNKEKYIFSNGIWEASFVFDRIQALEYGGYEEDNLVQDKNLYKYFSVFDQAGTFQTYPYFQFVFNRTSPKSNITSGLKYENFSDQNFDFGDEKPLIETDNLIYWAQKKASQKFKSYLNFIKKNIKLEDYEKVNSLFEIESAS